MPLTRKNGLKMAQAAFESLNGRLPAQIVLLLYVISVDPVRVGDPATDAIAEFFTGKGIPVVGIMFDPLLFETWSKGREDSQALRQVWAESVWNQTPDFATFLGDIRCKQKWTRDGWRNLRGFDN